MQKNRKQAYEKTETTFDFKRLGKIILNNLTYKLFSNITYIYNMYVYVRDSTRYSFDEFKMRKNSAILKVTV